MSFLSGMNAQYGQIDDYYLCREIGTGASCQVFAAFNKNEMSETAVAVKIISEDSKFARGDDIKMMATEVEILSKIKHRHIVKLNHAQKEGKLLVGKLVFEEPYTVLELAQNGSILNYLINTGRFSEEVSRYYFRQLIEGLNHVHEQGYIHRDIKPDNLLLNQDFELLISDFGHSVPLIDGVTNDGKYWTQIGTPVYNPPEIHLSPDHGSPAVDVFMAGAVLFTFLAGKLPFELGAVKEDPFYKHLMEGHPHKFWTAHLEDPRMHFSAETMDFISELFDPNPGNRLTMKCVINHPWFNSPVPSSESVMTEMAVRKLKMNKSAMNKSKK